MKLPFVGPSYTLDARQASAQRSVNLYLVGMETPSKAGVIMRAAPGLVMFSALGATVRGSIEAAGRCFVVAGQTLYEVSSDGSSVSRGTLSTSSGNVGMAYGVTQLVVVDGPNGYVLSLASNTFSAITSPAFAGSDQVSYLDGFFIFQTPGTQQFYATAIDDASDVDALDFASAESSPDLLVAHKVSNSRLYLIGERTTEVWYTSGGSFPFSRSNGETIDVGCVARWSLCKADAGLFWIGRDTNGSGIVYRTTGGAPQRVSTTAVEQALQSSTDLSEATAWVYQDHGQTFYAINAPGLSSTWVYEVATNAWHERCEVDEVGQFAAGRVTHHVFAHGKHLVGDAAGNVYDMTRTARTLNGDPLICERTSPNDAAQLRNRQRFTAFVLDCQTGESLLTEPVIELSWSNDGGAQFGDPVMRGAGLIGQRLQRLCWRRLGMARDRVWRLRFDAQASISIISGEAA